MYTFIIRLQGSIHVFKRLIVINGLHSFRSMSLRHRFRGKFRLFSVDIIRYLRAQYGVHSLLGSLFCGGISSDPCHNGDVIAKDTGISVKHFVPEYKLALLIGRFGGNVIF